LYIFDLLIVKVIEISTLSIAESADFKTKKSCAKCIKRKPFIIDKNLRYLRANILMEIK
jgi:hypothetical protein